MRDAIGPFRRQDPRSHQRRRISDPPLLRHSQTRPETGGNRRRQSNYHHRHHPDTGLAKAEIVDIDDELFGYVGVDSLDAEFLHGELEFTTGFHTFRMAFECAVALTRAARGAAAAAAAGK